METRPRIAPHSMLAIALTTLVMAALALTGAVGIASAATLTVCPSGCAFSQIAPALGAASNGDTIQVAAGTYNGGFTVTKSINLLGAGADSTTISGGGPVIFIVPGVSVTIAGVTVTGGHTSDWGGGGIHNDGGSVTLRTSIVSDKTAAVDGGGVYNFGGTLSVTASTVSGNSALHSGGGVFNNGGSAAVVQSAVKDNSAGDNGGGIFNCAQPQPCLGPNSGATMTLEQSSVNHNSAAADGGACTPTAAPFRSRRAPSAETPPSRMREGFSATAARRRSLRAPSRTTAPPTPGAFSTVRHRNRVRVPVPAGR
jgi:hypothetical protein